MALFYYQALERNGRKTKGMIEADSARHARQLLRGKELIPVHIEARMNASTGGMLQRRRHAHRRVAAADLALFTRQLATLVQAAMPLETCLQAVSEQSEKLHVKSLGMALRSRIQEGYTLSDSLREHPRVFDSLFCSMVAAGEKSGHLDVVLNRPGLHRTAAASEITPAAGHALPAGTAGGGNGRGHYFADGSSAENYRTV